MSDALPDETIAAWARLLRVSKDVLGKVEADLKGAGLPPLTWYDALLELQRAGEDGLRPFQLQKRLLLAQYNLSRLVERLVEAGYVIRSPSGEDGRGRILRISEAGRALLQRVWPVYRAAIAAHFAARLDEEDIVTVNRILAKLSA